MNVVFTNAENSLTITYSITNQELDEKIVQTAVKIALQRKYYISIGEDDFKHRLIRVNSLNIDYKAIKNQIEKLV